MMKQQNNKITVKNMVCNRCIKVVIEALHNNAIEFTHVDLGTIELKNTITEIQKQQLQQTLEKEGFELVVDRDTQLVNRVKSLIIEIIHYQKEKSASQNLSDFLSDNLQVDYTYISRIFSEIVGKTIERYTIEQKTERAKELLIYDELTLSQISYDLDYSSPQYLSRQFKQITGLTPSQFKKIGQRKKLDTI